MPEDRKWVSTRRPEEIQRVLAVGRKYRKGGIVIKCVRKNEGLSTVGIICSRRLGGAVVRNRAKRRIRHALDTIAPPPNYSMVVIANPLLTIASWEEVLSWFRTIFQRIDA